MKKKTKKLSLNKEIIAALTNSETRKVVGGLSDWPTACGCVPGDCTSLGHNSCMGGLSDNKDCFQD